MKIDWQAPRSQLSTFSTLVMSGNDITDTVPPHGFWDLNSGLHVGTPGTKPVEPPLWLCNTRLHHPHISMCTAQRLQRTHPAHEHPFSSAYKEQVVSESNFPPLSRSSRLVFLVNDSWESMYALLDPFLYGQNGKYHLHCPRGCQ